MREIFINQRYGAQIINKLISVFLYEYPESGTIIDFICDIFYSCINYCRVDSIPWFAEALVSWQSYLAHSW